MALMMSLLRAKEYLFTGGRIPAEQAVAPGLANRTVPSGDLLDVATALAHRLAGLPSQALQDTKPSTCTFRSCAVGDGLRLRCRDRILRYRERQDGGEEVEGPSHGQYSVTIQ